MAGSPVPADRSRLVERWEVRRAPQDTESFLRFVRRVKGGRYQARPYVGPTSPGAWCVGHINVGLYLTRGEALDAVRNWIRLGCNPCAGLRTGVHPKWVVPHANGRFSAQWRTPRELDPGRALVTLGPFDTAEAAHRAMADYLCIRFDQERSPVAAHPYRQPPTAVATDLSETPAARTLTALAGISVADAAEIDGLIAARKAELDVLIALRTLADARPALTHRPTSAVSDPSLAAPFPPATDPPPVAASRATTIGRSRGSARHRFTAKPASPTGSPTEPTRSEADDSVPTPLTAAVRAAQLLVVRGALMPSVIAKELEIDAGELQTILTTGDWFERVNSDSGDGRYKVTAAGRHGAQI